MGCGSSAKPTHTGRTASGYRYEKKENCRHYQQKKEPSEEIMTRKGSKQSGDGDDSVSTRASITSTKSSKDMIDWHEKHCTDRDFQYVKKIQEAYPLDEEKRKSVGKANHKSHGGSYDNITVAKMVKHINCGVCNVLVTKSCFGSEEVPFYHCKRCKLNGHKMDLCVSCYDAGELATGVRQKTAVSCEARHSYKLAPSLGPGSSPRPSLLDTPLPEEAISDSPSPRMSPVTALGLTEAEVPRSPSHSPRPRPSPRHCDSSTDLSEIRNSLGGRKSPRPSCDSSGDLGDVQNSLGGKSPRPSPRRKTMPAGLNLPPSSPNARSKSPRPSPRTKTMPAGLLVPSTEEGDAAQRTPSKGSNSPSAQKEAAKKAYLEHAAATKLQANERGRSARKEVAEKKVAQADAGHHHTNLRQQSAPTLLVPADPVDMIVHKSPRRNSKHSNH